MKRKIVTGKLLSMIVIYVTCYLLAAFAMWEWDILNYIFTSSAGRFLFAVMTIILFIVLPPFHKIVRAIEEID